MHQAVGSKASSAALYPVLAMANDFALFLGKRPQVLHGLKAIGVACPDAEVDLPLPCLNLPQPQGQAAPLMLEWRVEGPFPPVTLQEQDSTVSRAGRRGVPPTTSDFVFSSPLNDSSPLPLFC